MPDELGKMSDDLQAMRLDIALMKSDVQQIRDQAMNHLPSVLSGLSRDVKDLDEKTERLFGVVSAGNRAAHKSDNGAAGWRQAFYVVVGVIVALFIEVVKGLFR